MGGGRGPGHLPIVKRQDEARWGGKFRTRALILGYHRAYGAGDMEAWVKG